MLTTAKGVLICDHMKDNQEGKSATPGVRTPQILPSYSPRTPLVLLLYSLYSSSTPPVLRLYSSSTPPVLRLYFTSYSGVLESRFFPLEDNLSLCKSTIINCAAIKCFQFQLSDKLPDKS